MLAFAAAPASAGNVVVLDVNGGIGVATADYVLSGIEHAESTDAELIVIKIDTPGGLMAPMRDIVQAILGSQVPVATYVTPAGARADSAGTYILLASHVAAMTPTTHLGAATPVFQGGDGGTNEDSSDDPESAAPPGSAMERKVLNDAIAYIRGLAERYGRNAEWAERAVRDAATLTADEALEQNVIDILAKDIPDLLRQVNGLEVMTDAETVTLATDDVVIEEFEANWRIKILSTIANPETVLLLGLIGLYGLMYEGWNPGAIVPGVVGVICLLLAAYALQVLPVNYAGLALIGLGILLMVMEGFIPSTGILGIGGVISFVVGSVILMDTESEAFQIAVPLIIAVAAFSVLMLVMVFGMLVRSRRVALVSGESAMLGEKAEVMEDFAEQGQVWVHGELWQAVTEQPVKKGQMIPIRAIKGLKVILKNTENTTGERL
jgi:membrane-bound serine protease (ClpP class)